MQRCPVCTAIRKGQGAQLLQQKAFSFRLFYICRDRLDGRQECRALTEGFHSSPGQAADNVPQVRGTGRQHLESAARDGWTTWAPTLSPRAFKSRPAVADF